LLAPERRSKVTFEIEPAGAASKLTVVHDDSEPASTVADMVSDGWPALRSDLKSLVETGATVPTEAVAAG
jgi:hypothetical protein